MIRHHLGRTTTRHHLRWVCLSLAVMSACIGGDRAREQSIVAPEPWQADVDGPTDRATPESETAPITEPPEDLAAVVLKPEPEPYEYVWPYPTIDVMSDFWDCRSRRRHRRHAAIDLHGTGEDGGLGTAVFSIGTSRIVLIGRPSDDPASFGRPLQRRGTTVRGDRRFPTSARVDGYGRVYFFTRSRGRWRSGTVVVTELLEGPLRGYTVRYMHLGAVRPELGVGDLLKPGTEIGLLGGTGIQESPPHLHIDASDPDGNRIDLAPILDFPTRFKREIPEC